MLSTNITKNMGNWQIVEENRQLTKTIDSIIEMPGSHLNPIHIKGDYGVGKTHISLAASYEIQSIYGEESVRIIRSNTLVDNSNELPNMPQNIPKLKMILLEDFEELTSNLSRMQAISNWLIWNINNGVQLIITSDGSIDSNIGGDVKRLLDSSILFNIEAYSNTSKIRILRRLAMDRNVVLSDEHLSILINTKNNLPSLLSSFEKFIIAQKDGTLPSDPKEAIASLDGVQTLYNSMFSDDIVNTAKDIATKTVEATGHSKFELDENEINIELNLEDIPEIKSEAERIIDNDKEIISKWNQDLNLPTENIESKELLEELSDHGLDRMVDVGFAFEKYNDILNGIESRIGEISKTLESSDTDTLLKLADEMSDLEYSLQDLKPLVSSLDRAPLTNTPDKNIELPNLERLKKLDEYIPNNEWNIDSDKVNMDDLLNEGELNPVTHMVLMPTTNTNLMNSFEEE
ncbi:MAG: Chromosomal replication initiator protein DnaA [Methanobacteriota archaeon]|nr:MAG: Chromosomal replication initiator protein DnaA [Euryarchaeota archaeon]